MDKTLKALVKIDRQLVKLAKNIKILSNLSWKAEVAVEFLGNWRKGRTKLPKVTYRSVNYSRQKKGIRDLMKSCDQEHPFGKFLYDTGRSYLLGLAMLEHTEKARFTETSIELFGTPSDGIGLKGISILEAAKHFLDSTDSVVASCGLSVEDCCILPLTVRNELQAAVDSFFKHHKVTVELDHALASKATAGGDRIRLRDYTCFSPVDIPQLLHHEAFTHTLTLINGRSQRVLTSLGLGAPRTTRTQEGLAIFSELITNSMDINRLRRISSRVLAIDMALNGADFLDLFHFFLQIGQNEFESFQSAMRVFRGGNVKGKYAFTKDVAYLQGFVEVHTFLSKSIKASKVMYPHYLFSGRLCVDDVALLEPFFQNQLLQLPLYEPEWVKNRPCLMAFLVYSAFLKQLRL